MYNIDLYEENQGLRLPQLLLPMELIRLVEIYRNGIGIGNIGRQEKLVCLEGLGESVKKFSWRLVRQDVRDGGNGDEATEEKEHFPD